MNSFHSKMCDKAVKTAHQIPKIKKIADNSSRKMYIRKHIRNRPEFILKVKLEILDAEENLEVQSEFYEDYIKILSQLKRKNTKITRIYLN